MKREYIACKNCENTFEVGFQFCPHCGQKTNEELTVRLLFYNTISNYFSFDARFFKSFIPLMVKPGYLAKRFVEGKRLLYLHPAQMYLFISVVFFFLFSFISRDQVETIDKAFEKDLKAPISSDSIHESVVIDSIKLQNLTDKLKGNNVLKEVEVLGLKSIDSVITSTTQTNIKQETTFGFNERKIDSLVSLGASDKQIYEVMGLEEDAGNLKRKFYAQALKFYRQRNGAPILQAFYDTIPLAMFVLLPIFALLLKLFFYKKRRFSHHLVFTFYFFCFLFMVFSLLIVSDFIFKISTAIITAAMLSTFFYLFIAMKRFYNQGYFLSFIKSSLLAFLYVSFVIPVAIIIIGITAFMFY